MAVLTLAATLTGPALGADVERGRALYENHCQSCHSIKVHNRKQRWPSDRDQLRAVVNQWQTQQNLRWSSEDIEDVVYFLNVTQYSY